MTRSWTLSSRNYDIMRRKGKHKLCNNSCRKVFKISFSKLYIAFTLLFFPLLYAILVCIFSLRLLKLFDPCFQLSNYLFIIHSVSQFLLIILDTRMFICNRCWNISLYFLGPFWCQSLMLAQLLALPRRLFCRVLFPCSTLSSLCLPSYQCLLPRVMVPMVASLEQQSTFSQYIVWYLVYPPFFVKEHMNKGF